MAEDLVLALISCKILDHSPSWNLNLPIFKMGLGAGFVAQKVTKVLLWTATSPCKRAGQGPGSSTSDPVSY